MREIPRSQWRSYCDEFSRQHRGWLASLALVSTANLEADPSVAEHAVVLSENLRFAGIADEHQGAQETLTITLGNGTDHVAHEVRGPIRLFEQSENDLHHGLRVDERNGQSTLILFRASAAPEALDGLAQSEY